MDRAAEQPVQRDGQLAGVPRERDLRDASGLVSSTGVAGCIDAGEIRFEEPYNARTGPFGFGSISFSTRTVVYRSRRASATGTAAGVDLLGNSCDFSAYSATRSASARAAAGGTLSERIAPGTKAVSLRIRGSKGRPRSSSAVRTARRSRPRGSSAASSARAATCWRRTRRPRRRACCWSSRPLARGRSRPLRARGPGRPGSTARTSSAPPRSSVRCAGPRPTAVRLAFAYAVPEGAKVSLVERSRKGVARTLVKSVRGKPCRRARPPARWPQAPVRPEEVPRGARPGRRPDIQAIVTRGGIPLARKNVAKFRAPRQPVPSRPGALTARRTGGGLVVVFPASRGASRYNATAVLADGRRLSFDLAGKCRAVRIPKVPAGVGAVVKVAGVRYDVKAGRYRSVKLAGGTQHGGAQAGAAQEDLPLRRSRAWEQSSRAATQVVQASRPACGKRRPRQGSPRGGRCADSAMRIQDAPTSRRARLPASLLCVALLTLLAFAPSANAATLTITKTPDNPVVGESITFDSNATSDCALTYTWTVDGVEQAPSTTRTLTTSFSTAGTHTVALKAEVTAPPCGAAQLDTGSVDVEVLEGIGGSIAVSPDPPYTNEQLTLTAGQTGGFGPPFYLRLGHRQRRRLRRRDRPGTVTRTYTTDGPQVVRVRIRDGATPLHERDRHPHAEPRPAPGRRPRPPPPPPCVKRLAFELSEFTTEGCFTSRVSPGDGRRRRRSSSTASRSRTTGSVRDHASRRRASPAATSRPRDAAIQARQADRVLGRHRLGAARRQAGRGGDR